MSNLRPLHTIAHDILNEAFAASLLKGHEPTWVTYSKPYVRAMQNLTDHGDTYGADSAQSIILYALSNMPSWRGEAARRLKAELKLHLKRTAS